MPAHFQFLFHSPNTQQHGLSQAEVRSSEPHLDLPDKWQEPKYMGHLLLLPMVCISWKLESEIKLHSKPRYSDTVYKTLILVTICIVNQ